MAPRGTLLMFKRTNMTIIRIFVVISHNEAKIALYRVGTHLF
jgi:hypothetical protein